MAPARVHVELAVGAVRELRLVLTVEDFDPALAFYRDALGLAELEAWEADAGRIILLDAGRATIELVDESQAREIDRIEVGTRVAGPVRLALEVADSAATADRLAEAGAELIAGPVVTPWRDRNVRMRAPDGMQLTLFTVLGEEPERRD
jgi:catechol 2,3-dioxygenase-like lactoylglutathione lyase family enzyme